MSKISTKEIVKLLTLSTILVLLINFNVISGEINLTQTDQPIIIGSDSDFASYDLTGDGTTVDPFVISDLNFFPLDAGIVIENTTLAVIIMNNAFDGGDFGISIRNSTGIIEIINNQFVTGNKGIYVGSSNNIIIHNNSFTSFSDDAINVEDSNNIEIIGNYIQEAEIGLRLETSEDLEVVNNTISLSTRDGMRLNNISNIDLISNLVTQNNDDGIRRNLTNNVLFRDNFVIENTDGIRVDSSSDLVFEHNKMELNIEKGLRFQSSDTISVLSNLFINNGRQGLRFYNLTFQAVIFNNVFFGNNGADRGERDDSLTSGNTWYDINNEIGNYYQEFDDRAYEIKGDAEEIDFYPLEFIPSEVEDLIVGQESFRRPEPSSIGQIQL